MFSKKQSQIATATNGLAQIGKVTARAAQATGDAGTSGAKLVESARAAAAERLHDMKLPDHIQLPDVTLPKLQLGDVKREDVQLPDVTLPRFNAGNVAIQDIQLPDITVPRFRMGQMTSKAVQVGPFGLGAATGLRRLIRLAVLGLIGLAVAKEMSQPEEQRQWHGRVLGVPYDFRPPTSRRFRDACWNEQAGLIAPTPWGVGWVVNFRELMKVARATASSKARAD